MHSTFVVYLQLGFDHIADLRGGDHILFIVALAAGYGLSHWRHLLILVTAFTVGHSVTLALATLRLVSVSSAWVEFLIPVTILATGVFTLAETRARPERLELPSRTQRVKYVMALLFGLIHGLGFSNFLRAMLGDEESIALPSAAAIRATPLSGTGWTRILSAGAGGAAAVLAAGRLPF